MKDEKKAPKLRFKGFTDDWEQRKLGDVFVERSEKSQDGNEELLSVTLKDGVIKSESLDRKNNASLDKRNYKLVIQNDIAYNSMRMWQGALGVSKFSGIVSPAYTVIKLRNQLEKPYFYQYYFKKNEMLNVFRKNSQGLTSDTWNLKYPLFSRIRVFTASAKEQQQISSLLYLLDQTITLHEEKKSQLERLKSALLQKMFADKSGYPDVRFEDFSGEWEQCKLGNVAKITMGQSPNSKNYTDNPKDRILVQGNADMKDGQVHPRIWTTEITKTANKGDLILSVRAPVGDIGKTSYDVVIGRGVAAIKGNEFIFQLLKRMKAVGYWTKYSTGSTFESINSLEINNAVINLPREHEQNEVGNILSYVDHAITLQNYKIELVKKLKSSLLQNMFI